MLACERFLQTWFLQLIKSLEVAVMRVWLFSGTGSVLTANLGRVKASLHQKQVFGIFAFMIKKAGGKNKHYFFYLI